MWRNLLNNFQTSLVFAIFTENEMLLRKLATPRTTYLLKFAPWQVLINFSSCLSEYTSLIYLFKFFYHFVRSES